MVFLFFIQKQTQRQIKKIKAKFKKSKQNIKSKAILHTLFKHLFIATVHIQTTATISFNTTTSASASARAYGKSSGNRN